MTNNTRYSKNQNNTQTRDHKVAFIGQYMKVRGCHKIEIIDSNVLLQPYSEAVETHVTHGYQHISEFTHGLIGVEIGRRLLFDPQSQ